MHFYPMIQCHYRHPFRVIAIALMLAGLIFHSDLCAQMTLQPISDSLLQVLRQAPGTVEMKDELAFGRARFTTDVSGIILLDYTAQPIEAGKPLLLSTPARFSWRFIDQDSFFHSPATEVVMSEDQAGQEVICAVRVADAYQDLSKRFDRQIRMRRLFRDMDRQMVAVLGNEAAGGTLGGFQMASCEVTVSQYRLYDEVAGVPHELGEGPESAVTIPSIRPGEPLQRNINFSHRPDGRLRTWDEEHHPACFVTRSEAEAFCRWLTEQDPRYMYRLPTRGEWMYVLLSGRESNEWVPGTAWTNGSGLANLADQSLAELFPDRRPVIHKDWNDGYSLTAPVGTFKPGGYAMHMHDLIGNVAEWVSDDVPSLGKGSEPRALALGGSFMSYLPELQRDLGETFPLNTRQSRVGFRVVRIPSAE